MQSLMELHTLTRKMVCISTKVGLFVGISWASISNENYAYEKKNVYGNFESGCRLLPSHLCSEWFFFTSTVNANAFAAQNGVIFQLILKWMLFFIRSGEHWAALLQFALAQYNYHLEQNGISIDLSVRNKLNAT